MIPQKQAMYTKIISNYLDNTAMYTTTEEGNFQYPQSQALSNRLLLAQEWNQINTFYGPGYGRVRISEHLPKCN